MNSPASATLRKVERLHLRRDIDGLFEEGKALVAYPLRVVWTIASEPQATRSQMMVSVSKRYHRRATARNRIKRLVREAYRLHKAPWLHLLEHNGVYARLAFVSVAKDLPTYADVERAVLRAFARIAREASLAETMSESE